MTVELKMLAFSVVLGLVQIVLSAQSKNLQHGYRWAAGPRSGVRRGASLRAKPGTEESGGKPPHTK